MSSFSYGSVLLDKTLFGVCHLCLEVDHADVSLNVGCRIHSLENGGVVVFFHPIPRHLADDADWDIGVDQFDNIRAEVLGADIENRNQLLLGVATIVCSLWRPKGDGPSTSLAPGVSPEEFEDPKIMMRTWVMVVAAWRPRPARRPVRRPRSAWRPQPARRPRPPPRRPRPRSTASVVSRSSSRYDGLEIGHLFLQFLNIVS